MKVSSIEINRRIKEDPAGFTKECDMALEADIRKCADAIISNTARSSLVLLSGPSGAGKTTISWKLKDALLERNVNLHVISLDDYFITFDLATTPVTEDGVPDLESPLCLDSDLLRGHFDDISVGREILVPEFDFTRQMRSPDTLRPIAASAGEVVLFEGIHALTDVVTGAYKDAFRVYVEPSGIDGVVNGTEARFLRRVVRDSRFRGTDALNTLNRWDTVNRGERLYISPYEGNANYKIDSFMPYELSALKPFVPDLISLMAEYDGPCGESLIRGANALETVLPLNEKYVPETSIIREFLGFCK